VGAAVDGSCDFGLDVVKQCSVPPFASDFDWLVNLMAGKSYFGVVITNY
jgi:hypothetical protein